jgi:nicotinamidase-related amidase
MERLDAETCAVLVVDVQERLAQAMPEPRMKDLLRSARILIEGARELGAPVLATEQYPRGLGPTIAAVAELLDAAGARRFEKVAFSAWGADGFQAALRASEARSVVLIGMEAHVCVFQTARDLAASGYSVHVAVDGAVSRRDDHREIGLELCQKSGAVLTTSETVLFDWLGAAGSDVFRRLSALVKD